jgi:sugar lactone lactonase YvrE
VPNQFYIPRAICTDPNNNVYVLDGGEWAIQKFDNNGKFTTMWNTHGTPAISSPDGICSDNWGNIYTPDAGDRDVVKYSNTGKFICTIGTPGGNGPGHLSQPSCGICVDKKGCVYVCDTGNKRVNVYNTNGAYLCEWGDSGPGTLADFDYLGLGPQGQVYIVDLQNIKEFN